MKYLYLQEDGDISQSNEEPTADYCSNINNGVLSIIRFERGSFESAAVEEFVANQDEIDSADEGEELDEELEYRVAEWMTI